MIDISNLPELSAGGTTSITYTRDRQGRVIAAHCTRPAYQVARHARRRGASDAIQKLESLFTGGPVCAAY